MRKRFWPMLLTSVMMVAVPLQGCVQMPTEKAGIADLRPQISFRWTDDSVSAARAFIDGVDVGPVADFKDGVATLRVLPGTHVLRVAFMGSTLIDEKFYLGDGTQRTFTVNRGF